MAANRGPAETSGQRLIWCHEHCHNIENRERRQVIRQSMSEIGWSVTFHKKALQFSKWVEEVPKTTGEKYILVMGWREAQPCLRYLVQHRSNLPLMTVVVCNSKKQQNRAATFVQSLPSALGTVHVCVQDEIPDCLFNGRIRHCFGVSSVDTSGSEADSQSVAGSWEMPISNHVAAPPSPTSLRCPPGLEDIAPSAMFAKQAPLAPEALALLTAASALAQPLPLSSSQFLNLDDLAVLNSNFHGMSHCQKEVNNMWQQPARAQVLHL